MLSCINKILRAELDDETADWLAGATLVALYKPDGAGGLKTRVSAALRREVLDIRPIAPPETLYRVAALCGLAANKGAITTALVATQQLSVGVPSATEGIAAAVRLYLQEACAPGGDVAAAGERLVKCCISLDSTNAFNTIPRTPRRYIACTWHHAAPMPQFCDGGELFSRRRRRTEDLKTNATDQLCDKNSDVSFPRGRSQVAYESGVRCHARPKTFVEFCHYQASISGCGVGSPWARTRLFPVRIRRPRCKATCSRLRERQRSAAATPEEGKHLQFLIQDDPGTRPQPSVATN